MMEEVNFYFLQENDFIELLMMCDANIKIYVFLVIYQLT